MKRYVCERLLGLRLEAGLSCLEVSVQLGVSQCSYMMIEKGKNDLTIALMERLADLYNTSTDYILARTDERLPW